MLFTVLFSLLLGALVHYAAKALLSRQRLPGPLPPGPRPTPLLGNISDLPPSGTQEWVHWLKFKETYGLILRGMFSKTHTDNGFPGPVSSITVLGQHMIILNDAKSAMELLVKRSSIYSSRAHQVFASEMSVHLFVTCMNLVTELTY